MASNKGKITGKVTDQMGSPIINALVRTINTATPTAFYTSQEGTYTLSLDPGTYTIYVSAIAMTTAEKKGVVVISDQTITENFKLSAQPL